MTADRHKQALERLQAAARNAHPAKVARIAADLATEAEQAAKDAQTYLDQNNKPASMTAASIASAIAKMARVLETGGLDETEEGTPK